MATSDEESGALNALSRSFFILSILPETEDVDHPPQLPFHHGSVQDVSMDMTGLYGQANWNSFSELSMSMLASHLALFSSFDHSLTIHNNSSSCQSLIFEKSSSLFSATATATATSPDDQGQSFTVYSQQDLLLENSSSFASIAEYKSFLDKSHSSIFK
jgi:hypothetical protein